MMSSLRMNSMDEVTMQLVHYFITKENYQPIVVNGLQNEIWLENTDKYFEVIRINSNYIHNDEQLDFDLYKAKTVVKQIRKKMLSFKCNTLNIMLNVGDNVNNLSSSYKNMELLKVNSINDLGNDEGLASLFPELKNDIIDSSDPMDFFINITDDINEETERKSRLYDKVFSQKPIVVTYALIVINIIVFILQYMGIINTNLYATSAYSIKMGHYWVVLTSAFLHADIIHILCNMYSLYFIGVQLETVLGKKKFIVVYLISAIMGSLASALLSGGAAIGASGAIFGLIGAMLYFGYYYRLYLGNVVRSQIIPVILINLFIGFMLPGVDNFGHIGGLVGGIFAAMMVGIEGKSDKMNRLNGAIITIVLIAFLLFMIVR